MFKEVRSLSAGSAASRWRCSASWRRTCCLDEPTNHLDIPAREAIEEFLLESSATLLVVSHDRRLLETDVLEAVGRRRRGSRGGYDR